MAVQIILKNSSIEDKRPQASQLTNGEISLNYSSAGAFLCCTDTNGDVQQVGGVKIDETAPDAPVKQTLWFKPSTLTLSVYDGDKWLPIAGGGGGGGGGGGDIIQIIGNDGIDADTVAGIVTLDVELAGGDDGLEFKSSKLSATLASATDLGSVKVGDNINVTAGKISVPKATSSTFGVVKLGDGIEIDGDGSISIDVPTTTTYRGSCDLNTPPTGQINPDPALKGDAYINSADAPAVDAGWTGITGSAKIGDLVIFDGTTWDLIPLGAGTAPVTSVNGKTGDVVLDYTDVGAASEAQGDLADTALQPGDNISELNNDEGYITEAEAPVLSVNGKTGVVVLDAADVGALAPGDNVSDLDNDAGYITLAELPDQEPPVIISDTAPTGDDAVEGNLWFNSNDGRTYVYYKDGDSSQWVDASPDSGGAGGTVGDYWLEAGGYLSPKTGTNGVDIGGSKILLKSDGVAEAKELRARLGSKNNWAIRAYDDTDVKRFGVTGAGATIGFEEDGSTNAWALNHLNNRFSHTVKIGNNIADLATNEPTIELNEDGSSQFVGGMAIGDTLPLTPKITLEANGNITCRDLKAAQSKLPEGKAFRVSNTTGNVYIGSDNTYNAAIQLNADGSIITVGDIQSTSQNGGQLAGFRNFIQNGDFRIWQRALSQNVVGFGSADRWRSNSTRQLNSSDTVLPTGFVRSIRGAVANEALSLRHPIELFSETSTTNAGPFSTDSTWTLSWYVKCDDNTAGSTNVKLGWSADSTNFGTAASEVRDIAFTGDWARYSTTFSIQGAPSDTDKCLNVSVAVTPSSTGKAVLTGVQLEPGPVATPFEHRPIQTELALCQRYYYSFPYTIFSKASVTANWQVSGKYPQMMRAIPTVISENYGRITKKDTVPMIDGLVAQGTSAETAGTASYSAKLDAEL